MQRSDGFEWGALQIRRFSLTILIVLIVMFVAAMWLCIVLYRWLGWPGLAVGVAATLIVGPYALYAFLLAIAVFTSSWVRGGEARGDDEEHDRTG